MCAFNGNHSSLLKAVYNMLQTVKGLLSCCFLTTTLETNSWNYRHQVRAYLPHVPHQVRAYLPHGPHQFSTLLGLETTFKYDTPVWQCGCFYAGCLAHSVRIFAFSVTSGNILTLKCDLLQTEQKEPWRCCAHQFTWAHPRRQTGRSYIYMR